MKTISFLLALLLALVGCTTEIDLMVPGDPVPVVYCLLDPADSIQYIRLGQTYSVDPGNPDLKPTQEKILVDEDILVYMTAEYTDRKQDVYYASRVYNIDKDSGFFPSSVNQLYAIRCKIKTDTRYSLYIHFKESNKIVHAETQSLGTLFYIIDPELVQGRTATLLPGIDYYVRFNPVIHGSIFQSTMTFRYAEIQEGRWADRSMVLPQEFLYEDDTTLKFAEQRISGERFLIDVSRALKPDSTIRRVPLGLDFHISCGGDDLALKISAENNTQSFSILEVNSFDNAFGIFSCLTHKYVWNVPISRFTLDTLALGPMTRDLGFLTAKQIDSMNYAKY
ncbi:MAG: hypothetical protein WC699_17165 [Bacteroidales bacterium]|jgi:hypothetical protein